MVKVVFSEDGTARIVRHRKRERSHAKRLLAKCIPLREWVHLRPRTFAEIRMAVMLHRTLQELAADDGPPRRTPKTGIR